MEEYFMTGDFDHIATEVMNIEVNNTENNLDAKWSVVINAIKDHMKHIRLLQSKANASQYILWQDGKGPIAWWDFTVSYRERCA